MADKGFNNDGDAAREEQGKAPSAGNKKQSRPLVIIFVVFLVLVAIVFLTQRKTSIDWVENYEAGLEQARQQNKPVLLAFFKANIRYCTEIVQETYNNPDVKKYVEANFIPIFIDVDKQPEIGELYKVNYYPTHYVKRPDSDELFGPRVGHDPPQLFIREIKALYEQMKLSEK